MSDKTGLSEEEMQEYEEFLKADEQTLINKAFKDFMNKLNKKVED